jgi:hypothetical protein
LQSGAADSEDEGVTVLGPETLAEIVMDAGFVGWLLRKVSYSARLTRRLVIWR